MPNWCTNWIEIEGDKKTISKLTRIIKDASKPENKTGLFETLIGIKPNVAREDYDNGHKLVLTSLVELHLMKEGTL